MRTRLFVISSLAVAAVIGAANVNGAVAKPNGPGDIGQKPPTTTSTTVKPKGPDQFAPKPPQGDPEPGPQGPDDLAQPQPDPVVDPKPVDDSGLEPGPDTTGNGSGSDKYVPPAGGNDAADSVVGGVRVDAPAGDTSEAATAEAADTDGGVNPLLIIVAAAVVGALLALLATRMRQTDRA